MSEETKIVTANFAGNNETKPETAKPQPPARLNAALATEIGGALERWHTLRNQAIKTPTSDAEVAGLTEYLANRLLEFAPELLGCWFVVRNEYEPLIGTIATVMNRVESTNTLRNLVRKQNCCATANEGCCKNQKDS